MKNISRDNNTTMNKINYFNALNNTKLTKESLLCTLCSSWLSTPIYITSIGQNTCNCTKGKVNTRNKPLEILLAGSKYPCYHMNCYHFSKIEDFEIHQQLCQFAEIQCPLCDTPDLNEYTIIQHLEEHKNKEIQTKATQTVFLYQEQMPKITLNMSTTLNHSTIHIVRIQNGVCLVVWIRPRRHKTYLTIGQLHTTENKECIQFNFIQQFNNRETSTKGDVVTIRSLLNTKHISAELEQFSENVTLFLAKFEKCALLECLICMEYLTNKIYPCPKQHAVCSRCKPSISRCPTCRLPMNEKAIDLNRMLPNLAVPCANVQRGCLVYKTDTEHDMQCLYKEYECPWEMCQFKHCQSRVIQHMKEEHHVYHMGYGFRFDASKTFAYIEREGELFKVYIDNFQSDIVEFNVQMYFDNRLAHKRRYNIKLFHPDDFANEILSIGNVCQANGDKELSCPISMRSVYALCNHCVTKYCYKAISIKVYIF